MAGGRVKRRLALAAAAPVAPPAPAACALCARPLGRRIEWHHVVPKSHGGRVTVPLHPICHRAIHAAFGNAELAATGGDMAAIAPRLAGFLRWIARKPPDFHAPTRRPAR
jgi:hypothetical protein